MHGSGSTALYTFLSLLSFAEFFGRVEAQRSLTPSADPFTTIPCPGAIACPTCRAGSTTSITTPPSDCPYCTCVTSTPTPTPTTTTFTPPIACPATYIPCRCSTGYTVSSPAPCSCTCLPVVSPVTARFTPLPTSTAKATATSTSTSTFTLPCLPTYIPCRCSAGYTATTPAPCTCSCVPTSTPTTTTSPSSTSTSTFTLPCLPTYVPCRCSTGFTATTPAPCTCSCVPTSTTPSPSSTTVSAPTQTVWGQCGGSLWTGPTACATGTTCQYYNEWYSEHSILFPQIWSSHADVPYLMCRSMRPLTNDIVPVEGITPVRNYPYIQSRYASLSGSLEQL